MIYTVYIKNFDNLFKFREKNNNIFIYLGKGIKLTLEVYCIETEKVVDTIIKQQYVSQ